MMKFHHGFKLSSRDDFKELIPEIRIATGDIQGSWLYPELIGTLA
jgi:hypothetical protein